MTKKKSELHIKPTKEELEKNIEEISKDLEKGVEEEPTPSESIPEEPTGAEVPSASPEVPEEEEEPEDATPSKEVIKDMAQREKEKNIASAQEAQILHAKNKKTNEALDEALSMPEASDEDLVGEYGVEAVEMMSDFEKKMARESLTNKKRMEALNKIVKENKDLESWQGKVDGFIGSQETITKYPELEGKEDEFKLFATKPSRRNVDFEDLVSAFLFGLKTEPQKKGRMFPSGSAGSEKIKNPNDGKISIDDAIRLKRSNYKKYVELLKAGKIRLEV